MLSKEEAEEIIFYCDTLGVTRRMRLQNALAGAIPEMAGDPLVCAQGLKLS